MYYCNAFVAGWGAFGYATRAALSGVACAGVWVLFALIGFGVVLIFVRIPGRAVISSGGHFRGITMVGFQRLRRSMEIAASIFLDALPNQTNDGHYHSPDGDSESSGHPSQSSTRTPYSLPY